MDSSIGRERSDQEKQKKGRAVVSTEDLSFWQRDNNCDKNKKVKKRWTCNHQPYYVFLCVLFEHAHKCFGRWRCHQSLGLISIYLAGEDESKKNVPATTESTI